MKKLGIKNALINYLAGKGPMPLYYLQVGVGAKNYTSHEVIQMRGKALGLLKEGETTIPEATLDKETKKLFCHMPGDFNAIQRSYKSFWWREYVDYARKWNRHFPIKY